MNTADRSLALVDYALRRRFAFATLRPLFESPRFREFQLKKGATEELVDSIVSKMTALNQVIADDKVNLGPGFCVGHSYFCDAQGIRDQQWYRSVIEGEIAPLVEEYWCDHLETANTWKAKLLGA